MELDLAIQAALTVEIASLQARYKAASGYIYNNGLQIECAIIEKQISDLQARLYEVTLKINSKE